METVIAKEGTNPFLKKVYKFQNSLEYMMILAGIAYLCQLFSFTFFGLTFFVVVISLTLIFNPDGKAVLPSFILAYYCVGLNGNPYNVDGSGGRNETTIFTSPFAITLFVILGVILLISVIYNIIKYKRKFKFSFLSLGLSVLCGSFLLGGTFFSGYSFLSLAMGAFMCVTFFGVFTLFSSILTYDKGLVDYVMQLLVVLSLMVALQLFTHLLVYVNFDNVGKADIVLGWGNTNAIGAIISFCVPSYFYFMLTKPKFQLVYFSLIVVVELAIFFAYSRAALGFSGVVCLAGLIYFFIKGKNRKGVAIALSVIAVAGLVLFIVFFDKIAQYIQIYLNLGFSNNGRIKLLQEGIAAFLSAPFFGTGFMYRYQEMFYAYMYHNTIVEMLGAFGIVGILAYIFHRAQTVKMLVTKITIVKLVIGAMFFAMLAHSLFDNMFFHPNFSMLYSIMLVILEKDHQNTIQKEYEKKLLSAEKVKTDMQADTQTAGETNSQI